MKKFFEEILLGKRTERAKNIINSYYINESSSHRWNSINRYSTYIQIKTSYDVFNYDEHSGAKYTWHVEFSDKNKQWEWRLFESYSTSGNSDDIPLVLYGEVVTKNVYKVFEYSPDNIEKTLNTQIMLHEMPAEIKKACMLLL